MYLFGYNCKRMFTIIEVRRACLISNFIGPRPRSKSVEVKTMTTSEVLTPLKKQYPDLKGLFLTPFNTRQEQ